VTGVTSTRGAWLTRRIPASVKRLVPVVRERDALREQIVSLRARVDQPPPHVPREGLHGAYVGGERMLIAPSWGGRLLMPSDDISLMPELVVHGTYDVPFTAFVRRHIKPGDTVFDVGANVGLFTLLLAYQVWEFGRVVAYEAHPRMIGFLRDNVAMNWLTDRVEIVPKAAAASSGHVEFLAPRRLAMTGSIRPVEHLLTTADRIDTIDRVEVETEPLDAQLGRFERIDLVKIDVEGAEERVLAGMEGLLASDVVRRVSFEVSREHLGDDWDRFTARLRALAQDGWGFSTISDAGAPTPIELDAVFERGRFSQILMTRA
jgi:FkbM family methyltransferase